MDKARFPRSFRIYLPLILLFVCLLLLLPRSGKFNYDYRKGSPWLYETLIAQFDFPVLKTASQLQEERENVGSAVLPYYRYNDSVTGEILSGVEHLNLGDCASFRPEIRRILAGIYSLGVIEDAGGLSAEVIYIQRDKRAAKYPVSEVYNVSDARSRLLSDLRQSCGRVDADSLCRHSGLYDLIAPNLFLDKQTTELIHDQTVNYISPTSGVVKAGTLIVSHGEIITAEIEQMLNSYKVEYENSLGYSGSPLLMWGGNALLAFALVFILFFTIYYSNPLIFNEFNRYIYILAIFFLAAVVTFAAERAAHVYIYFVPYSLIALYLSAFFKNKLIYPVYIVSLLPLLIFAHDGIELFVMYFVAGVVAIFSFGYFNKGWLQFVTAFFVYISLIITYMAFRLMDGLQGIENYRPLLYLGLGSLLYVDGYPLIYHFERIFNLVSNSRLIELSDTNNKLLRELAHKAPGTFQHSLQVMNMADAAARAIDGNVALVRCGALYHDIGKTANPLCFIENETAGSHYHQGLKPQESARDILRHVPDGLAIAEKAKLPAIIRDFILTHHGTTCTAYFYNKYLAEGGDPANEGDFRYNGRKPTTKEQIILMLCDTIEAASRTLKDFTAGSISELVEGVVAGKMREGQFVMADISLKELDTLKKVLKEYIAQVHHARVVYPKRPGDR